MQFEVRSGLTGLVHAPDTAGDVHQRSDKRSAGEEPGKSCATTASEPEATGKLSPTSFGEQVGGVLGAVYLPEFKLLAAEALLDPQAVTLQVPQLA